MRKQSIIVHTREISDCFTPGKVTQNTTIIIRLAGNPYNKKLIQHIVISKAYEPGERESAEGDSL